jgi:hypothetical protein
VFRYAALAIAMSALACGCTSTQRIQATPHAIQSEIRAGAYLRKDQSATIRTIDGHEIRLRFSRIEADSIVGTSESGADTAIPIPDVVGLMTDRVDVGRSVAAVAAGSVVTMAIVLAVLVSTSALMTF